MHFQGKEIKIKSKKGRNPICVLMIGGKSKCQIRQDCVSSPEKSKQTFVNLAERLHKGLIFENCRL